MPTVPCIDIISCPGSNGLDADWPIQNWTSEALDKPIFVGVDTDGRTVPPLGSVWYHSSCIGICESTVSQADANLCAANSAYLCATNPPGGGGGIVISGGGGIPSGPAPRGTGGSTGGDGGGGPPPFCQLNPQLCAPAPVFSNTPQTCVASCPNGGSGFSYTLPAGSVVARSQLLADRQAYSIACQRARDKVICLGTPLGTDFEVCVGDTVLSDEDILTVSGASPPFNLSSSGQLPNGTSLVKSSDTSWVLLGQFTKAGNYVVTVTVGDAAGSTANETFNFSVLGITNGTPDPVTGIIPLAQGVVFDPYNAQLTAAGGDGAYTFTYDPDEAPAWLTLTSGGAISGTPDTIAVWEFDVTVTDGLGQTCSKTVSIDVIGPNFTNGNPPNGTECSAYNFTFTAVPAGCNFSGTVPPGLHLAVNGVVTGYPSASGPRSFSITADNGNGHPKTKTWNINVTSDGSGIAKSVADIGTWSPTVVSEGGGASHSGGITNGNGTITFTLPPAWPTGTERVWFEASLGRCASQTPYNLNWSLSLAYNGQAYTIQNVGLTLFGTSVHTAGGTTAGFNDSGIIAVPPGNVDNIVLDCQFNGSGNPVQFTGIITISLSPDSPP